MESRNVRAKAWRGDRTGVALLVVAGMALGALETPVKAAEQGLSDPEIHVASKTVTGTIVAMTKRSLSVEYSNTAQESFELLLPFGDEMSLERIKSVSELKRGDTVSVGYRQFSRDDGAGNRTILKTAIASIALVKSGATGILGSTEGRGP